MIPDSIPFVLLILTIFFAPLSYGHAKTPAATTFQKEATK